MGYCMNQVESKFFIKKKNKAKALHGKETISDSLGRHFSWVNSSELFTKAIDFAGAMKAWRWIIEEDENSNVIDITFGGEKLGDDEILFGAIAPFVEDGSYIEMRGEDDGHWRWVFSQGKCSQQDAVTQWDGDFVSVPKKALEHLIACASRAVGDCGNVVNNWEKGDLAQAVTALNETQEYLTVAVNDLVAQVDLED